MEALEFELPAKVQDIRLQKEHNNELMHQEEALCAENAQLQAEFEAARAIPTISTISHSNLV